MTRPQHLGGPPTPPDQPIGGWAATLHTLHSGGPGWWSWRVAAETGFPADLAAATGGRLEPTGPGGLFQTRPYMTERADRKRATRRAAERECAELRDIVAAAVRDLGYNPPPSPPAGCGPEPGGAVPDMAGTLPAAPMAGIPARPLAAGDCAQCGTGLSYAPAAAVAVCWNRQCAAYGRPPAWDRNPDVGGAVPVPSDLGNNATTKGGGSQ